ncbi:MAG TPA: hypothetical protein VE591_12220 [Candidatus Acidoferrum sp.]|nr:hypothetical protein [Candidatus Acidoferrum sp.]
MFLALTSALTMFMQPVNPRSLASCYGPCLKPAFQLHGYAYDNESHTTKLPFARNDGKAGNVVHISFTPPFTGICEVFEVVQANGKPAAQHLAERPVQPHVIHLELNLPTDEALRRAGETPFSSTMIGMDCWHFGHESDVTYSRFYELSKAPPT